MNNTNLLTNTMPNAANFEVGLTAKSRVYPAKIDQASHMQVPAGNLSAKSVTPSPFGVVNRTAGMHWHFLDAQDDLARSFELIKVLRQHQTNKGWTLLIAPSHIPDKALLDCCSVDMSHVLIVREKQITNMANTIEKALKFNTCSAIVAWCHEWHTQLNLEKLQQLSILADNSRCHVYAFNKGRTSNQQRASH